LHLAVYDKRDLRLAVKEYSIECVPHVHGATFLKSSEPGTRFTNALMPSQPLNIWRKVFEVLVVEADMEWVFIDGTCINTVPGVQQG
jgi:hypothetical protein